MGANFRPATICDIAQRGNVAVRCECGHVGVVSGEKLWRYFFFHRWDTRLHMAKRRMRCRRCGGRPERLGLTHDLPTGPEWGPKDEVEWKRLIRRLRG